MSRKINDGLSRSQRHYRKNREKREAQYKAYRERNKEKLSQKRKEVMAAKRAAMTPEQIAEEKAKIAAYHKEYRKKNKAKRKAWGDAWRKTDAGRMLYLRNYKKRKTRDGIKDRKPSTWTKEKRRENNQKYWRENKEKLTAQNRTYRHENREKLKEKSRQYYRANKRRYIEGNNHRNKERRKADINFKILSCLRGRVRDYVVGRSRSKLTMELLGCSCDFLRSHLENQFEPGMTWENYGRQGWHIDHRRPLSLWPNLSTDIEVQRQAFHYTNLSPKWGVENSRKGNRFAEPLLPMLAREEAA